MNPNLTEIICVLDASGSMMPLRSDTIGGYNALLEQQKSEPGDAFVTTVLFNSTLETIHDHVLIYDVPPLTEKDYCPSGMTALLDAVGYTIEKVGKRLAATPENDRPANIIFVITTDGAENVSHLYSLSQIKEMIEHQQSKYAWQFLFIGAGIDAYQASSSIGINAAHTASYDASLDGINMVYTAASKGISSIRCAAALDTSWKDGSQ